MLKAFRRFIKKNDKKNENKSVYKDLTTGSWQTFDEFKYVYDNYLKPIKPKKIIEIGVAMGGTSRIFLDLVGPDGVVVGVDISKSLIDEKVLNHPKYKFFHGFSTDPKILKQIKAISEKFDAILIDGDHTVEGVLKDTELYLPLIRNGGLVMWHDVRLEPPAGIKQTWYGHLRKKYIGSSDYFIDECNNGIGFWFKSDNSKESLKNTIISLHKKKEYKELQKHIETYLEIEENDREINQIYEEACLAIGDKNKLFKIDVRKNFHKLLEDPKYFLKKIKDENISNSLSNVIQELAPIVLQSQAIAKNSEIYLRIALELKKHNLSNVAEELFSYLKASSNSALEIELSYCYYLFSCFESMDKIRERIVKLKHHDANHDSLHRSVKLLIKEFNSRCLRMQKKDLQIT